MPELPPIQWPVVVVQNDGGTVSVYASIEAMQGALERVDIENGEYPTTLDANGRTLRLVPLGNYGVEVAVVSADADQEKLLQALRHHLHLVAEAHSRPVPIEHETLPLDALLSLVADA